MHSDKIMLETLNDLSKDKWCASRIKLMKNVLICTSVRL